MRKNGSLKKLVMLTLMCNVIGLSMDAEAYTAGYAADAGGVSTQEITKLTDPATGNSYISEGYSSHYNNSGTTGNVAIGNYSTAGGKVDSEIRYSEMEVNPNNGEYDYENGYTESAYDSETGRRVYGKVTKELRVMKDKDGNLFEILGPSAEDPNKVSTYPLDSNFQRTSETPVDKSPERTYNATAVGNNAKALADTSAAYGADSKAEGYRSVAVGPDSRAGNLTNDSEDDDGISSVAVGDSAQAYGNNSVSVGKNAQNYGLSSVAVGNNSNAAPNYSIAIGDNATVAYIASAANDPKKLVAEHGIAIGRDSRVEGKDGTAVGRNSLAKMRNSTAYGNNSHADGYDSTAIGNKSIAQGESTVAVGNRATAKDEFSTAIGTSSYASGTHSVAVGDSNRATGKYSTAMGAGWSKYTVDEDDNDNTEKDRNYESIGANQATGDYSTAVGFANASLGENSSVFGKTNVASGKDSLAYGSENQVGQDRETDATTLQEGGNIGAFTGFAVGHKNKLKANMTGAFGDGNNVEAQHGYAIGNGNTVTGEYGLTFGTAAKATAEKAIAIGQNAEANKANSVALGDNSKTNEVVGTTQIEIPGTNQTYDNISGTAPVGTVSVGDKGKERTITNVAAGRIGPGSTDAVNGSELYAVSQEVGNNSQNINFINKKLNNLDNRVNKIGAGAAALAGLHPLDFDPDEKWDFAAGYGHYSGSDAVAIGAFYRPNEDTMFSLATTVGTGEDMISAGFSVKVGQHNHVSINRVALAKEVIELRKEINDLRSFIADQVAGNMLDLSKIQLFPDTPENHWAYDYVATLAGNGVLEGYPDGYFKGDRQMTRYEMAGVLYRAMLRGIQLKERALREFAPELDRIRVDTITKHDNGMPSIQRVRAIKGRW